MLYMFIFYCERCPPPDIKQNIEISMRDHGSTNNRMRRIWGHCQERSGERLPSEVLPHFICPPPRPPHPSQPFIFCPSFPNSALRSILFLLWWPTMTQTRKIREYRKIRRSGIRLFGVVSLDLSSIVSNVILG